MGGLRSSLSKHGITLDIVETSELLGNVSGGSRQGAAYDGVTQITLQMDTQRAFHHPGGTFNISALQIHGTNLSEDNLSSLQTASGIEAGRSTRLWELWYDQNFLKDDKLDVKIGQQSLDEEFMVSQNALLFVNALFGWAMVSAVDLPGGGPVYPLSALGIRAAYRPNTATNLLFGVFSGSPAPYTDADPQRANPNGLKFPVHGALAIAEAQFISRTPGSPSDADKPPSRVIKIGAWYDTEKFSDQRYDTQGVSLADPNSSGVPRQHRGNYSVYGALDQRVWHSKTDDHRSLNLFARLTAAPQEDRSLIDYSANLGAVLTAPFRGRDNDSAGLGLGFVKIGGGASGLDRDTALSSRSYFPVRTSETCLEATYQYQAYPWLQVQPDVQYIFNPGGGVINPNAPSRRSGNELILGTRVNIQF